MHTKSSDLFRAPQRISITLPQHVYEHLQQRSLREGRSLSNLSAYLLEHTLEHTHSFETERPYGI